jgi:hypothetical protein
MASQHKGASLSRYSSSSEYPANFISSVLDASSSRAREDRVSASEIATLVVIVVLAAVTVAAYVATRGDPRPHHQSQPPSSNRRR